MNYYKNRNQKNKSKGLAQPGLQQYQMLDTSSLSNSLFNSSYGLERGIIADSHLNHLNRYQHQPSYLQQYQMPYYTLSSFGNEIDRNFIEINNQFNHLNIPQSQPNYGQQYQRQETASLSRYSNELDRAFIINTHLSQLDRHQPLLDLVPNTATSSGNELCRDIITGTQLDKLEKYSFHIHQSRLPWYGFQYGMPYLDLQSTSQLPISYHQILSNLKHFYQHIDSLFQREYFSTREECYPQAQSNFYAPSNYSQSEILHSDQTASQLPEQLYPLYNYQNQQNFFNINHTMQQTNEKNLLNDKQTSEFIQEQRLPAMLEASLSKLGARLESSDTECKQYKLF